MPEGWPTKAGGAIQGLLQGTQFVGMMSEQARAEKKMNDAKILAQVLGNDPIGIELKKMGIGLENLADSEHIMNVYNKKVEMKQREQENDYKGMTAAFAAANNPNLADEQKRIFTNIGLEKTNKLFGTKTEPLTEWNPQMSKFVKKLNGIIADKTMSIQQKLEGAQFLWGEAITSEEQKALQEVTGFLGKQEETQNLSQGIGITGLLGQMQKQPSEYNAGFTPEQITSRQGLIEAQEREKYIGGGDIGRDILKERMKEKTAVREFTIGDKTEYWEVDNNGKPIRKVEGMGGERFKPPSTTVNIGTEKKFLGKLGETSAESFTKERENAQQAVNTIGNIMDAKKQLDAGIYSGFGANIKLGIDKILQTAKINIGGTTAANTEAFAGATGKLVGKIIKDFGSGTGLSDADREYAEKIAGGKITLTEQSIRKLFGIAEKAQRIQIRMYNKKAIEIEQKYGKEEMPFNMRVEEPTTDESVDLSKKSTEELKRMLLNAE